jgi:energy-coupling factor transport system ATP-binding protein
MSLTLEKVSYSYARGQEVAVPALDAVRVQVEPGSLVLIVGATGSGKSTLMRIAAGLLAPDAGRVLLDGAPLSAQAARGAVGLIFQDPESQLFADTVLDDVAFGPRNLGASPEDARELAREALSSVGLEPDAFAERSPFSLSGGEARRAAIAGVLAMRPRYLLADEPTAGLDEPGRRAVVELLAAERERAGVAVVSHAAEEFLESADTVVILAQGAVSWSGSAEAAVADPGVFEVGGVRSPDVLEVQRLARERGLVLEGPTLDPVEAGERLARAGGWV